MKIAKFIALLAVLWMSGCGGSNPFEDARELRLVSQCVPLTIESSAADWNRCADAMDRLYGDGAGEMFRQPGSTPINQPQPQRDPEPLTGIGVLVIEASALLEIPNADRIEIQISVNGNVERTVAARADIEITTVVTIDRDRENLVGVDWFAFVGSQRLVLATSVTVVPGGTAAIKVQQYNTTGRDFDADQDGFSSGSGTTPIPNDDAIETPTVDASIPFSNNSPTIDGIESIAEWENGATFSVNRLMLAKNGFSAVDGQSGATFTAQHDGSYLYLKISHPVRAFVRDSNLAYQDDSFELFFDSGNEGSSAYDLNDYQYIGRATAISTPNSSRIFDVDLSWGQNSATGLQIDSMASVTTYNQTYVYEVRILLSSMSLPVNKEFGFEVHLNDDINGGERDIKWGFAGPGLQDFHWKNPSYFGTARLVR